MCQLHDNMQKEKNLSLFSILACCLTKFSEHISEVACNNRAVLWSAKCRKLQLALRHSIQPPGARDINVFAPAV